MVPWLTHGSKAYLLSNKFVISANIRAKKKVENLSSFSIICAKVSAARNWVGGLSTILIFCTTPLLTIVSLLATRTRDSPLISRVWKIWSVTLLRYQASTSTSTQWITLDQHKASHISPSHTVIDQGNSILGLVVSWCHEVKLWWRLVQWTTGWFWLFFIFLSQILYVLHFLNVTLKQWYQTQRSKTPSTV